MKEVKTYWANIYIGCKDTEADHQYSIPRVEYYCREYANRAELCVTVTPTEYIYTNAESGVKDGESGAIVGLINYPRRPSSPEEIQEKAIELAQILKKELFQHRVSVMFPDKTIMLGDE